MMLKDGFNALIDKLNECNYDTSMAQLNDEKKNQLIQGLTTLYVGSMQRSHENGSHETYRGPYIFPNQHAWRFIGNRPDMIADAYIRLRLLLHWQQNSDH